MPAATEGGGTSNHDKVEREMPLGMSLSQRSVRSSPRSKPADETDTAIHIHTVSLRVSSIVSALSRVSY
jgi:hypothetical protein